MQDTQYSILQDMIPKKKLEELYDLLAGIIPCSVGIHDGFRSSMGGDSLVDNCFHVPALCDYARQIDRKHPICTMSDSYAAMEASFIGKPYLYVCPMGVIDCIAPIIIDDIFVGSIQMGRILTDPDKMNTLPHIPCSPLCSDVTEETMHTIYEEHKDSLEYVPWELLMSYVKVLETFVELITALAQNSRKLDDIKEKNVQIEKLNERLEAAKLETNNSTEEFSDHLNYHKLLKKAFQIINDLALTENADQTSDALVSISAILDGSLDVCDTTIPFEEELSNIEKILNVYGLVYDNLDLTFDASHFDGDLKIPENIFVYLIKTYLDKRLIFTEKPQKMSIEISSAKHTLLSIQIEDNGLPLPKQLTYSNDTLPEDPVSCALVMANHKLEQMYPDNILFTAKNTFDGNALTSIRIYK